MVSLLLIRKDCGLLEEAYYWLLCKSSLGSACCFFSRGNFLCTLPSQPPSLALQQEGSVDSVSKVAKSFSLLFIQFIRKRKVRFK